MEEIIYGAPLGPRIKKVTPMENFELLLEFNNGEVRSFDFKPKLIFPAFQRLKDKDVFSSVYVDYGTVAWCDGEIDYCPDTLYAQSEPVNFREQIEVHT